MTGKRLATNEKTTPQARSPRQAEDVLIADARAQLTPSQMVERKLVSLLRGAPLPVSQLQRPLARRRPPA